MGLIPSTPPFDSSHFNPLTPSHIDTKNALGILLGPRGGTFNTKIKNRNKKVRKNKSQQKRRTSSERERKRERNSKVKNKQTEWQAGGHCENRRREAKEKRKKGVRKGYETPPVLGANCLAFVKATLFFPFPEPYRVREEEGGKNRQW